jgi:hypothetical protein
MVNNNKPVFSVKVGAVQFSVWENEVKDRGVMHSVTIDKSYKSGEEWKTTKNFSPNDLVKVSLGIQKVLEFLYIKDSGF